MDKNYDQQRSARKSLQMGVRLVYIFHKRLIKSKNPVLHHCDSCGRPFCETNCDMVEIQNTFGLDRQSLQPSDNWIRIKCKSCGAHISILFK